MNNKKLAKYFLGKLRNLYILLVVLCGFLVPFSVFAHPGRLDGSGCHYCRTNCASWGLAENEYHCHNGNTYTNSRGQVFDKDGAKISDGNSNVANDSVNSQTPSDSNVSNGESNVNNNSSNDSVIPNSNASTNNNTNTNRDSNNNISNDNYDTNIDDVFLTDEKDCDATIKDIKVNGKNIKVSDRMTFETQKKRIDIDIVPTSDKSKVDYELNELEFGENEILIKVIAEDGTQREYKLMVNRIKGVSSVTIVKLTLGSNDVVFENYKARLSILNGEKIDFCSYELSDKNAKVKLFVNDKEVKRIDELKNGDVLNLVVVDEDDNELIYEVSIKEMGAVETAIVYIILFVMLIGPIVGIVMLVKFIKKKKGKVS